MTVGEAARTVVTGSEGEQVAVHERVVCTSVPADEYHLSAPDEVGLLVEGASLGIAVVVSAQIGRGIVRGTGLTAPVLCAAVFVTAHQVEVVIFVEVLVVLGVGRGNEVVLLLGVLTVPAVVVGVGGVARGRVVLTTRCIFASEVHVQADVLQAVNLIVGFEVAEQHVRLLVEGVVLNLLYGVRRRVAVAVVGKGGVVARRGLRPLPVTAPALELVSVAHDGTRRIHTGGIADGALTAGVRL